MALALPKPGGVAPILIARTADPERFMRYGTTVFPRERFIGTLLIVESRDGDVRAVLGSVPNGGITWSSLPERPATL